MSTFQARIEDRIGTVSDTTALSDWLTSGAKYLITRLSEDKFVTTDLTDSGSGVAIAGYRLFRAHKSGYNADFVDAGLKSQVADSNSIYYANTKDPKAYIENGKLYVKPSGGTGIVFAYPTVLYSASAVTGFPVEYDEGLVLYASIQGATQKYNLAITTLNGLSTPTTTFSLTQANSWINTDEDIELGNAELNQHKTYIDKYMNDIQLYNVEAQRAVQEVNTWNGILQELRTEFKEFLSK
jgi:hypothetical protein